MDHSQAPQTQPAPAPQPSVAPQPSAPAPLNKKLIMWIGIGVGALLLVGATIAIIVAIFSVSKDDYRKAYSQMSEVSSANYDLNSKISSIQYGLTSSTDTKFKNDVKAAEEAVEKVRSENKELSELKAVKVGEGKKQYDEFNKKLDTYLTFTSDALKSISDIRDASVTCDKAGSGTSSSAASVKSALDECVTAFKKVGDTPNEDVKAFVKKMVTEAENLASLMAKMAEITDPYGDQYDQYKAIRDQVYDAQDNMRDAQTDFRSNFEKHTKEVDVKDVADDLGDFLSEQARR